MTTAEVPVVAVPGRTAENLTGFKAPPQPLAIPRRQQPEPPVATTRRTWTCGRNV